MSPKREPRAVTAPTPNAELAYRVTFERIGRSHAVPAQTFKVVHADELAEHIYRFGKRFLGSRDVEVLVDMEAGTGWFSCGGRNGGRFTFMADRPYGSGCSCAYLGEGTPEHTPSGLCLPGGEP